MVDTALGLYTTVFDRLKALRTRLDRFQSHPKHVEELRQTLDQLYTDLQAQHRRARAKDIKEDSAKHLELVQHHVDAASAILEDVDVNARHGDGGGPSSHERTKRWTQVGSWLRSASKKIDILCRTTRTEEALTSAKSHLESARDELHSIQLKRLQIGVDALSIAENDEYRASIRVTPNPANVVFDFESVDDKDAAVTYEGRLKQAVMTTELSSTDMVSDKEVTAVTGGGGMGKSCAVRGLGDLKEVRERFTGGIYEISLGMNATISKLIDEICACIQCSGGNLLCKELWAEGDVRKVVQRAGTWFNDYRVLFLVDDVWENNEITLDVFVNLKWLLGSNGSRMVFTSRSSKTWACASKGLVIEFNTRGVYSKASKGILLENAGMEEQSSEVQENEKSFKRILEVCGGLPLALAVAGQLVRNAKGFRDPFRDLLSRLKEKPETMRERGAVGYGALSGLLDEAVVFVQRQYSGQVGLEGVISVEEMMECFCVLEKQQFVPVSMLRRLWRLSGEWETRDIVEMLCNVGLVKKEVRQRMDREEMGDIENGGLWMKRKRCTCTRT